MAENKKNIFGFHGTNADFNEFDLAYVNSS